MSSTAFTNRSIKNIKTELEFLAESGLLSQESFDQIVSLLPNPTPASKSHVQKGASVEPSNNPFIKPTLPTRKTANTPIITPSASQAPIIAPTTETPSLPPPAYNSSEVLLRALYDYGNPENTDDLAFSKGDQIVLTAKLNQDWWTGRHVVTKQEGMFPSNYVEIDKAEDDKKSKHGDNMMIGVAHEGQFGSSSSNQGDNAEKQGKFAGQGKKFGSKLGNAAIFGAGATMGSKIVNGIF